MEIVDVEGQCAAPSYYCMVCVLSFYGSFYLALLCSYSSNVGNSDM